MASNLKTFCTSFAPLFSYYLTQGGSSTSFCCLLIWFDLMQHHFVHYEKGTTLISFNKINLIKFPLGCAWWRFFLDWSSWSTISLNYEFVFETHKTRHNISPKKCSHQLLSAVSRLLRLRRLAINQEKQKQEEEKVSSDINITWN